MPEDDHFAVPDRIGLCPSREHVLEFYVPLREGDSEKCPECPCDMVIYERVPQLEPMPEEGWKVGDIVLVDEQWQGVIVPPPTEPPKRTWCVQFTDPRRGGTEFVADLRITRDRRTANVRRQS